MAGKGLIISLVLRESETVPCSPKEGDLCREAAPPEGGIRLGDDKVARLKVVEDSTVERGHEVGRWRAGEGDDDSVMFGEVDKGLSAGTDIVEDELPPLACFDAEVRGSGQPSQRVERNGEG